MDLYFTDQWLGKDSANYRQQITDHLDDGGLFAFTMSGADISNSQERALKLADDFKSAVMFMHNDTINIAEPNAEETQTIKLPGFYKT